MPSLISHQLSIIKYCVLWRRLFLLSLFWPSHLDFGLEHLWTTDLSWTRQRWTWLQPYYMNILICIQLREYTDRIHAPWHNTRQCKIMRCNRSTLITIVAHQNLCVTSVTWLLYQPRDVVCSYSCFESRFSLYSHTMRNGLLLRNTEYVERWYCYLCIAYIFLHDLTCES